MKQTKFSTRKKLMASASMLMVSVMMLGSATYAWFSMNKQVSVSSMSISAKSADPIIEISANGNTFYNNLVSSGASPNWTLPATTIGSGSSATPVTLKLVTPTAIPNTGVVSWGWAASTAHDNAQKTNATTAKLLVAQSTPAPTENNRAAYLGVENDALYVLTQKLTIRNVSPDVAATNLVISAVNINKGTNTIGNAVRVLFVNAAGAYAIYEPGTTGTAAVASTPVWLTNQNSTAMSATSGSLPIVISQLDAKGTGQTAAAGSSTTVDVYVFFDGTDDDAFTDNATDLSDVTIDFTFAID